MLIGKIIISTIVIYFDLFGEVTSDGPPKRHAYPVSAQNFTLDHYLGVWYEIALIYPLGETPVHRCEWIEITHDSHNSQGFYETYFKFDEERGTTTINVNGLVFESQLLIRLPDFSLRGQVFDVHGYNNGEELILIDTRNPLYSGLVSRVSKASLQAKAEFERMAGEANGHVIYVNHTICRRQQ